MSVVLLVLAAGCGDGPAPGTTAARSSTSQTVMVSSLPCDEADQTRVALDVPGPGRPTPEEAVAPHAGALELVARDGGERTSVLGLRADGSVFRVFDVSRHDDGWWPDGYRECWS
ncbi:hypothetical protein JOE61_000211 [Nocardioides salarius]|uniref:SH3 domain-containing protein n=1 Tax=Nocardioides salarius TaxID=374513 RepID=A0ABS2M5F7_9ACTN|nr:hypothetical protein [Nocardioides salarius]